MSQGLIIFIAIGAILSYFLVGFITDLQSEDDRLMTQEKMINKEDRAQHQKDIIGQTILVFKDIPYQKKLGIWQRSPLRQEFMALFPNFSEMKVFVNDRIVDKDFQDKLSRKIDEIEDAFVSGDITLEQAKESFDTP